MWEIKNAPSATIEAAVKEVEAAIGAAAAAVERIEFFPGSTKDAEFTANGYGGAAYPWENPKLIVINANTNAGSKKTLQGTLAHEIGHCIDWRDTGFEWHHWAPAGPLDALAIKLKDKFAEFFASGYAIKLKLMASEDDWRKPLQDFAAEIRRDLLGPAGPTLAPAVPDGIHGGCGTMTERASAVAAPPRRRRRATPEPGAAGTAGVRARRSRRRPPAG